MLLLLLLLLLPLPAGPVVNVVVAVFAICGGGGECARAYILPLLCFCGCYFCFGCCCYNCAAGSFVIFIVVVVIVVFVGDHIPGIKVLIVLPPSQACDEPKPNNTLVPPGITQGVRARPQGRHPFGYVMVVETNNRTKLRKGVLYIANFLANAFIP